MEFVSPNSKKWEPSLKLDQESETDPTTARAGAAWSHALGGQSSVVIAADYEQPAGFTVPLVGATMR